MLVEQGIEERPERAIEQEIEREVARTLLRRIRVAGYANLFVIAYLVLFSTFLGAPVYDVDFWTRAWAGLASLVLVLLLRTAWAAGHAQVVSVGFLNAVALSACASAAFGGDFDGNAVLLAVIAVGSGALFPWGVQVQSIHAGTLGLMLGGTWLEPIARPEGYAQLGVVSSATAGIALSVLVAYFTRRQFEDTVRENVALRDARDEIRNLNRSLERKVADRTRELDDALADQQSFTYAVSHDLRQPLRHVDGYLHMIDDDNLSLDTEQREYLDRAYAGLARAGRMIDALLQISRLGIHRPSRRDIDVTAMAAEIVEELRHDHPGRDVEVRIMPAMVAAGEPRLVRALLAQLLANAWKFTGRAEQPRIEVGREPGGVYFVRDNGVGFDMEFAGKMFETFQRLHAADEFPGEGVGLAMAQRVVRRHGGAIQAQGAPGEGALFRFTLDPTASAAAGLAPAGQP